MKWWHWLILELLIIFGVISWIYFFPGEIEDDFAKCLIGFVLIYAIDKYRETNRRKRMSDAMERPKTYEEGLIDGFRKGQEETNKVIEQMLHTSCNPIVYAMPETEAVRLLQEHLQLYKKAFCLFVNWAEENDIGYENIDGNKYQEELDSKGLGYIEGMMYIALKEAKNEHSELYDKWIANVDKAISD